MTGADGVKVTATDSGVEVRGGELLLRMDLRAFADLAANMPAKLGYEMRNALGRMGGRWRKSLVARHAGKPMQRMISRPGKGGSVFYTAFPRNVTEPIVTPSGRTRMRALVSGQRLASAAAAADSAFLSEIALKGFFTSMATRFHEDGGDVKPSQRKLIAIPLKRPTRGRIKPEFASVKAARAAGWQLFRAESAGGRSRFVLMGQRKGSKRKAEPLFALVGGVRIQPTLGSKDTWDSQSGDQDKLIGDALTATTEAWAKRGRS
jgi:hypothetical protein